MTIRRLIFWTHLCTGLVTGLVIAFLAITGCILAFQPQVINWAERDAYISTPQPAPCVAPSTLLKNATSYEHRSPVSLTFYSDPHRPVEIAFGPSSLVLVNGCDGHLIGNGAGKLRGFFLSVRELHRAVTLNGVRHENLRQFKNVCVLAFLFLIVSGLILWFPRKVNWRHLRPSIFFRNSLRGRARDWNWHNVFGFWMSLPLAAITLTGVIMAYSWANALLFRAAGSAPPERMEMAPKQQKPLFPDKFQLFDEAIEKAKTHDPQWKKLLLRLPAEKDPNLSFTLDEGEGNKPQQRAQLVVARKDGRIIRWEPFSSNTRGRQWRLYARFLHTGEIFGWIGQAVAFIAAFSAIVLVWTGFSLALRRGISWKRRKSKHGEMRTEQQILTSSSEEVLRV
jgi:uncharacterized iron-regulated membrane protein